MDRSIDWDRFPNFSEKEFACQHCGEHGIDERIVDVKFKTYGCGSAIASSTLFVDMLKGKTIEEAKQVKDKEIAEALELPPIKLHCSVLADESIKNNFENYSNAEWKILSKKFNFNAIIIPVDWNMKLSPKIAFI